MKKRVQFMMLLCFVLGNLSFVLSSILRHSLTDFMLGFFEGLHIVFMCTWFIYMCWCFVKKKNPFSIK
ncbi:MAG: hypothetical protein FH753_15610 [Firmicutes bacterium]|nr:hypothetical protein [Bacillota bacterium]